jgi:DNA (cytosine-5)-methyltransferase 1
MNNKLKIEPKVISLFCGAGGCSLGFKQAGYSVSFANDIDEKAIKSYQTNFPDTETSNADINSINFQELLKNLKLKSGELDVLIGGPPCQGFSTAGVRFWDDSRNHLLKSYINALDIMKPKWFLMENVEGLLTSNNGVYVSETIKAFIELGYKVRMEKIYAQEYGVPQRRKRVIIVGNRLGIDFKMPEPTENLTGNIFRKSSRTLADTLLGLPKACRDKSKSINYTDQKETKLELYYRQGTHQVQDHFYPTISEINLERFTSLKSGQTMKDLPEHLQHSSFKKRANRRVSDGTPSAKRGGAPSGIKRLIADEPCLTITSAATRELIHPNENRPLTIRECARIQTFPDNFIFIGNSSQKIQQIGNAIPPTIARVFALHIKNTYGFQKQSECKGELLGYRLTKANAMSPALKKTDKILQNLLPHKELKLF